MNDNDAASGNAGYENSSTEDERTGEAEFTDSHVDKAETKAEHKDEVNSAADVDASDDTDEAAVESPDVAEATAVDQPVKITWYDQEYSLKWARKEGWHYRGTINSFPHFDERLINHIATIIFTVLAGVIRLWHLGRVKKLAFDETYYVKDSYSMYHLGYAGKWADSDTVNPQFIKGDYSGLSTDGAFVVHPPFGKWLMSLGMHAFGPESFFGWRIVVALMGTLCVLILLRIVWLLFDSALMTIFAGLMFSTETLHIALSRVGLLDGLLATFILAAFLTFIKDQLQAQKYIALDAEDFAHDYALKTGTKRHYNSELSFGQAFQAMRKVRWMARPWLILTGILLGLACGIKWSALYVIAVLGLYLFIREVTLRFRVGVRRDVAFIHAIIYGGLPAFFQLVPVAIITYVLSWMSWFTHPNAWGHGKAVEQGNLAADSIFAPIVDFFLYHKEIYNFHLGVSKPHTYQSTPLQWLFNVRPTSMVYEKPYGDDGDYIVQAVLAIGNPMLFWFGVAALMVVIASALVFHDWRAGIILCGYLGIWAPWLQYSYQDNRTIFMFYMVALSPFVVLAVTYMVGTLTGHIFPVAQPLSAARKDLVAPRVKTPRASFGLGVVLVVIVVISGLYFMPLATGAEITHSQWQNRMWLNSWI